VSPALPAPDVLGTADQITASTTQTCAHFSHAGGVGAVWCWGGPDAASQAPHEITGIIGTVNAIAAGEAHACAATDTGVFCWGHNKVGQLGSVPDDPNAPDVVHPTVQVNNVPAAKVIAAGRLHTCAGTGSQLYCWGANDRGQDGNGTTTPTALPALVQGAGASFVGAGEAHTCSAPTSGSLSCWGANGAKQIDGSLQDQTKPRGTASGASAMAGGVGHTCAIESGGAVVCWGLNDLGQLASADTASTGPSRAPLVQPASIIAAGTKHTCALVANAALGVLECWGSNEFGQLGTGTVGGKSPAPVAVTNR
jgi:alpha-tubulin suppressor-like RCC1 family protein